jgi:hypothetical protein
MYAKIPNDVLFRVLRLVDIQTAEAILLTCKSWNVACKATLAALQPLRLFSSEPPSFTETQTLNLPLIHQRPSPGPTFPLCIPLDPKALHRLPNFPNLTHLNLTQQQLPEGFGRLLLKTPCLHRLKALDLNRCTINPTDLQTLSVLTQLTALGAGELLFKPVLQPGDNLGLKLLQGVMGLTQLNALNMDATIHAQVSDMMVSLLVPSKAPAICC